MLRDSAGSAKPRKIRGVLAAMTLTGCIGVFLSADMVSFYFLLALLSLGACGLVIHHETRRAWRAGAIYIGLALLAEAFLLMAFVLLAAQIPGDSLLIRDAAAALSTSPRSWN